MLSLLLKMHLSTLHPLNSVILQFYLSLTKTHLVQLAHYKSFSFKICVKNLPLFESLSVLEAVETSPVSFPRGCSKLEVTFE